jgi:hypothetical protein
LFLECIPAIEVVGMASTARWGLKLPALVLYAVESLSLKD